MQYHGLPKLMIPIALFPIHPDDESSETSRFANQHHVGNSVQSYLNVLCATDQKRWHQLTEFGGRHLGYLSSVNKTSLLGFLVSG